MIFAQQFMVDALGLHFSAGSLLGGETFVRQEVAKLHAAQYQYQLAEQELTFGDGRTAGQRLLCRRLLHPNRMVAALRAAQGQEVAQHHIATRLSYLDH